MGKVTIFKSESLPRVNDQYYELDPVHQWLLVGPAVAKSVIRATIPLLQPRSDGALAAHTQRMIDEVHQAKRLGKQGGPELFRDAETKTVGMNFTASVIAVRGIRALHDYLYNPGEDSEECRRLINDAAVLSSGTRRLYTLITGKSIPASTGATLELYEGLMQELDPSAVAAVTDPGAQGPLRRIGSAIRSWL